MTFSGVDQNPERNSVLYHAMHSDISGFSYSNMFVWWHSEDGNVVSDSISTSGFFFPVILGELAEIISGDRVHSLCWDTSGSIFLYTTLPCFFSIFALSLGAIGCLAMGGWSNQGRKMFLFMGLFLVCAVLLQFSGNANDLNPFYPNIPDQGVLGTEQIIMGDTWGLASTYPSIGFFIAVAGVVLSLFAWRCPKWLDLPGIARLRTAKFTKWLEASEREKLAALFLGSLLMVLLLIFPSIICV